MTFRRSLGAVSAAALMTAALSFSAAAQTASAQLKDKTGKSVGTVELMQAPAGVVLKIKVTGLPAGEHAFHIHTVGKCEAPFESAGGHFNPDKQKHGVMAGQGHAGDMPNLFIPTSGELSAEVFNTKISLAKGAPNSVFDTDGSSVVIHAGVDDYKSDPAGNAGDRIACGVIGEAATVGSSPNR